MKPYAAIFVIFLFTTISCKDDVPCDDLDWLDNEIETIKQYGLVDFYYVYQAEYKRMTVYYVGNCCPNCSQAPPSIFNCQGKSIGILGDDIKSSELKNGKIYWQADNFPCTLK